MAKRYGRNQKRRHREEIARQAARIDNLEVAYARELGLLEYNRQQFRELRSKVDNWDADVQALLGRYSALRIEPARMKAGKTERISRVPLPLPIRPIYGAWAQAQEQQPLEMYIAELKRLICSSGFDQERLRQIVRLVVERPDGSEELHFAYAIAGQALMKIGKRDFPYIVKEVAKCLWEAARD